MKTCPYCKIEVGGDFERCPLCQNQLIGQATEKNWPSPKELRKQSRIQKPMTFAILSAIIVFFLFDLWGDPAHPGVGWSIIIIIWLIIFGLTFRSILRSHSESASVITRISIAAMIALVISSFPYPILVSIIPIPLICILAMNFLVMLIDKTGSAMVYFMVSFATGILSWIVVIILMKNELGLLWRICFMVSCITFVGTLIFRGRSLLTELKKRFTL